MMVPDFLSNEGCSELYAHNVTQETPMGIRDIKFVCGQLFEFFYGLFPSGTK
jgi:hypothetical protein